MKTLQLYALTFSVRLFSIMRHQGYLPFDKTGDWFYHMVCIAHVFGLYILDADDKLNTMNLIISSLIDLD